MSESLHGICQVGRRREFGESLYLGAELAVAAFVDGAPLLWCC